MPAGRILITIGVVLVVLGLLVSYTRLGQLPGDFFIGGKNFSFYFPLTTCILISIVITVAMWILRK